MEINIPYMAIPNALRIAKGKNPVTVAPNKVPNVHPR